MEKAAKKHPTLGQWKESPWAVDCCLCPGRAFAAYQPRLSEQGARVEAAAWFHHPAWGCPSHPTALQHPCRQLLSQGPCVEGSVLVPPLQPRNSRSGSCFQTLYLSLPTELLLNLLLSSQVLLPSLTAQGNACSHDIRSCYER